MFAARRTKRSARPLASSVVGIAIVAMFVGTWAVALSIWRLGRIEERWTAHLEQPVTVPVRQR